MKDGEIISLYYIVHIKYSKKYLIVYNHRKSYKFKLKDIASFTVELKGVLTYEI